MAVTQGHGNPDWVRDEILLALDLYFKRGGLIPGPTDPEIVALSEVIRQLPIHAGASKRETFRNPAGVAFKLQNLRQVATGKGLDHASVADRSAWADFGDNPDLVHQLAVRIREQLGNPSLTVEQAAAVDEEEEFSEGRVLTALHRTRERSPKIRTRLIAARLAVGGLACDACGAGPKVSDQVLGPAGFEAHHVVPLALTDARSTRLKDLALMCATCHRMIHRAMSAGRAWVTMPQFRQLLEKGRIASQ